MDDKMDRRELILRHHDPFTTMVKEVSGKTAGDWIDSLVILEAKEYFEKVYQIKPKYEDVTEKLIVLCLMHGEIDNFFKYNKECEHPLEEDMILDLLNSPEPVSYTHLSSVVRMTKGTQSKPNVKEPARILSPNPI